jgi:hypothetical protein
MTRRKLILSVAATCSVLSLLVYSHETDSSGPREPTSLLELVEAETQVKLHELDIRMSELEVTAAKVEVEKRKLMLEGAREKGDSRAIAMAELEIKGASIRLEMRMTRSEMARVRTELVKALLEHRRAALNKKPGAN